MNSCDNVDNARATIGALLKIARNEREWTQARLANFLGVGVKTVRDWEAGRSDGPTAVQLGFMEGAGIDTNFIVTAGLDYRHIPPCMYDVEWLQKQPRADLKAALGTILEALNRLALREIARLEAGEAQ